MIWVQMGDDGFHEFFSHQTQNNFVPQHIMARCIPLPARHDDDEDHLCGSRGQRTPEAHGLPVAALAPMHNQALNECTMRCTRQGAEGARKKEGISINTGD